MRSFRDFNIQIDRNHFTGEKVKITKILNKPIEVHDYKIVPSTQNDGKCLHLQIVVNDIKQVVFTGSKNLMQQIERVNKDELPFKTTIEEDNDAYLFK